MPDTASAASTATRINTARAMRPSTTRTLRSRPGALIRRASTSEPSHIAASRLTRVAATEVSTAHNDKFVLPIGICVACSQSVTSASTPVTYIATTVQAVNAIARSNGAITATLINARRIA